MLSARADPKAQHVTPVLRSLHWLPVFTRFNLKMLQTNLPTAFCVLPSSSAAITAVSVCWSHTAAMVTCLFLVPPRVCLLLVHKTPTDLALKYFSDLLTQYLACRLMSAGSGLLSVSSSTR